MYGIYVKQISGVTEILKILQIIYNGQVRSKRDYKVATVKIERVRNTKLHFLN